MEYSRYYDALVIYILGLAGYLIELLGRRAMKSFRDWLIVGGSLALHLLTLLLWFETETSEVQFWTLVLWIPIATVAYIVVFMRARKKNKKLKRISN